MREIKFRAWHEYGYIRMSPKMCKPGMVYDEKPGDCLTWKNQGQKIIDIMQWTGIKDRTGTDVYEGDIIELSCGCCRYRVVWDDKRLCWWPKDDGKSQVHGFDDFDVWAHKIEIIGNIYENPEMASLFKTKDGE